MRERVISRGFYLDLAKAIRNSSLSERNRARVVAQVTKVLRQYLSTYDEHAFRCCANIPNYYDPVLHKVLKSEDINNVV